MKILALERTNKIYRAVARYDKKEIHLHSSNNKTHHLSTKKSVKGCYEHYVNIFDNLGIVDKYKPLPTETERRDNNLVFIK